MIVKGIQHVFSFGKWYAQAKSRFDVDSPFVSKFISHVLESREEPTALRDLRDLRDELKADRRQVRLAPMGAGSSVSKMKIRTVRDILHNSVSTHNQQALLYRLIKLYQPKTMLELGTCLGISAVAQWRGHREGRLYTIEGDPALHQLAKKIIKKLEPGHGDHIKVISGSFANVLPSLLNQMGSLDYLFIDGDHHSEALLSYYDICKNYLHEKSIVVIHDLYWSKDMHQAWIQISRRPEVTAALDLYHSGILFFNQSIKHPLRYALISARFKPTSMGFFRN